MSKTVPFQTIQFSINTQFKCKYTVQLSKTFLFQAILFSQIALIQTIQFSISMQLVLFNPYIGPYHSGPEWTLKQWQRRGAMHFPKLYHHSNLTIRLFSVISRTLIVGGFTPLQSCNRCILPPQPTGQYRVNVKTVLFQIIQFSICTQFKCQNSSISSNSF